MLVLVHIVCQWWFQHAIAGLQVNSLVKGILILIHKQLDEVSMILDSLWHAIDGVLLLAGNI